jgi:hypothetical protein
VGNGGKKKKRLEPFKEGDAIYFFKEKLTFIITKKKGKIVKMVDASNVLGRWIYLIRKIKKNTQ